MRYDFYKSLFIVVVGLACVCSGCKSVRQVVEDSSEHDHTEFVAALAADTIQAAGEVRTETADTVAVEAQECGTVEISRDSLGLPVRIIWTRDLTITGNSRNRGLHDYRFAGVEASARAEVAGATDTDRQRHEDKKTEVRTPKIDNIIGAALMGLLFFCLFYIFCEDIVLPWIKKKFFRR